MTVEQFEKVSTGMFNLRRENLISEIKEFQLPRGGHLDFTPEFLNGQSDDQLRHILMGALCTY